MARLCDTVNTVCTQAQGSQASGRYSVLSSCCTLHHAKTVTRLCDTVNTGCTQAQGSQANDRYSLLSSCCTLHHAKSVWLACVQAQKSQGDDRGLRADLLLHAVLPGMPAATLPLTLTPGAPKVLQLLPGHPWEAGVSVASKTHMLALLGHPRFFRFAVKALQVPTKQGGHQQLLHPETAESWMQDAARGCMQLRGV